MITRTHTYTDAKVFRRVINRMRKWNVWLHVFTTQLPMFDQDMWLYYMDLKQHFFSSVFFRFSLMLTMYEKKNIFLVVPGVPKKTLHNFKPV